MDTGFAFSWFSLIALAFLLGYVVLKNGKPWDLPADEIPLDATHSHSGR